MSARYSIVCDECGAVAPELSRKSVASARLMTPKGWANPRPGRDLCPACAVKVQGGPDAR